MRTLLAAAALGAALYVQQCSIEPPALHPVDASRQTEEPACVEQAEAAAAAMEAQADALAEAVDALAVEVSE